MIYFSFLTFLPFCFGYIKKDLHSVLMAIIIICKIFRYIYSVHEGDEK